MRGNVTLAPILFKSRFMGSSIITYGTLFDDQSRNIRTFGDIPLSEANRSRELILRHVEAPCESSYPGIANVPFDLVR